MFKVFAIGFVLVALAVFFVGAGYWYGVHSNNPTQVSFSPIVFATPTVTPVATTTPVFSPLVSPPAGLSSTCPDTSDSGYALARGVWTDASRSGADEFLVDLKGDGTKELVRVYNENASAGQRSLPIEVKVFSDATASCKEAFHYTANQTTLGGGLPWNANEVGAVRVLPGFLGDAKQVFLFQPISTGYGSGYGSYIDFLMYQAGSYHVVQGPQIGEIDAYKIAGTDFSGQKLLVARSVWVSPLECHFCDHRIHFESYEWADGAYIKTDLGTTQGKYNLVGGPYSDGSAQTTIDAIIQKEPGVLTP